MALIDQALATMRNARIALGLYTLTDVTAIETLVAASTANITFNFVNTDLAPNQFGTFSEVSGTASTTISTSLITLDLELGTCTFSAERTGDITCASYVYYAWNYDYDSQIERLINSASIAISQACNRNFIKDTYASEWHKGHGRQRLILDNFPINYITSVKQYSASLTAGTDYITSISTYLDQGVLFKNNGWTWDGYLTGLVGELTAPIDTIEVSYSAGYTLDEIPDIENVCINLVSEGYHEQTRESQGLKKLRQGELEYEWGSSSSVMDKYGSVLSSYCERVF